MKHLPLYCAEHVRLLEQAVFDAGETAEQLMARAGAALFAVLRREWPGARKIGVLLGSGQNAGDGLVLARLAQEAGFTVALFGWCRPQHLRGAAAQAWLALKASFPDSVVRHDRDHDMGEAAVWRHFDVIVDAGFGIGLSSKRPLNAEVAGWIEWVNAARRNGAAVLAADLPSGLRADTGSGATVIEADVTVSFLALKPGLLTGRGPAVCGRVFLAQLDVMLENRPVVDVHLMLDAESLPLKPCDGHKGRFGTALIVAGNRGMMGAARMAAEAALRVGAGKVIVATHPEHATMLAIGRPELIVHGIDSAIGLDALLAQADAVVLGPGLGHDSWAAQMAQCVLSTDLPLIVDADGLRFISPDKPGQNKPVEPRRIMTPHPGEAARLLGCMASEVEQDRLAAARALHARYGMSGVLKGAGSVLFLPTGLLICGRGDPALATAGSGDVLAGVIGGLLAQGRAPSEALSRGVCWHAMAGEWLASQSGSWGAVATDLFAPIRAMANGRQNVPPARVSLWP